MDNDQQFITSGSWTANHIQLFRNCGSWPDDHSKWMMATRPLTADRKHMIRAAHCEQRIMHSRCIRRLITYGSYTAGHEQRITLPMGNDKHIKITDLEQQGMKSGYWTVVHEKQVKQNRFMTAIHEQRMIKSGLWIVNYDWLLVTNGPLTSNHV